MLLSGIGPGQDDEATELAAERAARATRALLTSRQLLGQPALPASRCFTGPAMEPVLGASDADEMVAW